MSIYEKSPLSAIHRRDLKALSLRSIPNAVNIEEAGMQFTNAEFQKLAAQSGCAPGGNP
jgi:hypothetical protein